MTHQNPFEIRQPAEELRLVGEFQHHAILSSILLREFHAVAGTPPAGGDVELKLDLEHEVRRSQIDEGSARFDVALKMKVLPTGENKAPLFEIEACFEAAYALWPGFQPSEEQAAAFRKGNVLFHCWPYLRELVHNTTWRMGIMLPPLPLLRVIPEAPAETGKGKRATEKGSVKNKSAKKTPER